MVWFSPTGHIEGTWTEEESSYDDDFSSWADEQVNHAAWTGWLTLTIDPAVSCDKLRFYANLLGAGGQVWVEFYYEGDWHLAYQGGYGHLTWYTVNIPEGAKLVSKVRLRIYNYSFQWDYALMYEVDLGVVPKAPGYANCIAQWRMNDNAANSDVINNIDNNFKGTYHGTGGADDYTNAHSVPGKIKTALEFDGVQDYISVPDDAIWNLGGKLTIMAWFKTSVSQSLNLLVQHDASHTKYGFYIEDSSNRLRFILRTASGWTDFKTPVGGGWADGQWHLVIGSFDRTLGSKRAKIYYEGADGVGQVSDDSYDADIVVGDEGINIGGESVLVKFSGCIDNVLIFNKVLSVEEIAWLWNGGNGRENLSGIARPLVGGSLAGGKKGLV